jgi:hypothetical protein
MDFPLPRDGVKGRVDLTLANTGTDVRVNKLSKENKRGEGILTKEKGAGLSKDVKCQICFHKKQKVQAVNMCIECGHFYFCQDCTDTHARNKATKNHLVTYLWPMEKKDVAMCKAHDTDLTGYCRTCGTLVCTVCVMLDHGDHTIEELRDTIDAKVDQVKYMLEKQERKLKDLQGLKYELSALNGEAPTLDKQDMLITEIDDHAQKCIDQIVKWKEDLKNQVRLNFKIIRDIPVGLKKVSDAVQKILEPTDRAGKLLTVTEYHPVYLDKLITLQRDLEALSGLGDGTEEKEFKNKLCEINKTDHSFIAEAITSTFGKIDTAQKTLGTFNPKEIFKHKIEADSADKFIPCVANLGKKFAVAHPTRNGEPSSAIDIYEFPGKLKITLNDHVYPIYDMSSTPDGKLAILSDGNGGKRCCVKVFHPETGHISSTQHIDITKPRRIKDFDPKAYYIIATQEIDISKPISLGVTLRNQYIILGDNEQGLKQITIVDKEGTIEHKYVINIQSDDDKIPDRITCGGRLIFVKWGHQQVTVYEMKDMDLEIVTTSALKTHGYWTDISATIWEDVFSAFCFLNRLYLGRYKDKDGVMEFSGAQWKNICEKVSGADREARVSTKDGHAVMSYGQTIMVYEL